MPSPPFLSCLSLSPITPPYLSPAAARVDFVVLHVARAYSITSHTSSKMRLRGLWVAWTRLSKSAVATDSLCNSSPRQTNTSTAGRADCGVSFGRLA